MKKLFMTAALAVAVILPWLSASGEDFDLGSQRGEVQEFNTVPGCKIDHKGLVINPTPHSLVRGEGRLPGATFTVKSKQSTITAADYAFLPTAAKGGVRVTIDYGGKAARKAGVEPVAGAYKLTIDKKGVTIIGYDDAGAFYGLQTLRQIAESEDARNGGGLPYLTINDFPSMKYRGVVEGFYGTPWSHAVRMSLLDFYGRNKLNNYIYGPKDDPYHSSPYWRQPYPEAEAANIRELVETAKKNRVDFVWAIHPGKDIRWTKEDYDSLVGKLDMMYDLGVRHFALFFDDIDGIGTDPHNQAKLLNDLNRDFVERKGDVGNILICPTDYSQLWAKPGPDGPLAVYGRELNRNAEVFWTGAVVCSDLTPETLEFVNSRIKRPALYWWNYPVTDYCRHIIMQGPVYGLDTTLTSAQVAGIESNPMEHGEASKLALYGVADYSWNPSAYNAIDNWERGLVEMMPDAHEAYRTFAIHSTDTETGYRRDESWETTIFPFDDYTPAQFEALKAEFERVAAAPAAIRKGSTNPGLTAELEPWLAEAEKVGRRGLAALRLIKTYEAGNDSVFWESYVGALMTPEEKSAFEAHKVGTMKLHPFYENAMNGMVRAFAQRLTGGVPAMYKGIASYANSRTTLPRLMLDGDTTTFYTGAVSQSHGDWIGVDLCTLRRVDEVLVHQGRNSVDDVDYFERAVLEVSVDGQKWQQLTDSLERTYIVSWKGSPVDARYVRIRRLDSPKTNWASVRSFSVNPISEARLGLNVTGEDAVNVLRAFDTDPSTAAELNGEIGFDRVKDAKSLTILASRHESPMTVVQVDSKGKTVATTEVNGAYGTVAIQPETVRVTVGGTGASVYELVQR